MKLKIQLLMIKIIKVKKNSIFLFAVNFFCFFEVIGQLEINPIKINNPVAIYANISAGLPISILNKNSSEIIKNDLKMNYNINKSTSVSSGIVISNLKNNFGGKFNFSFISQTYNNDSLIMNLNLTSYVLGLNYCFDPLNNRTEITNNFCNYVYGKKAHRGGKIKHPSRSREKWSE
ncbi:MAG: hypothetical protein FGM14_16160, partial [Flavobacteriales bacterium]|nr:hypothetical protein [Flavobacteriales bacterium]